MDPLGLTRSSVVLFTDAEFVPLQRIGKIVAEALAAMQSQVRAGITTEELDAVAETVLRRHGARSTPQQVYGFPGSSCVSVNSEAVHGVPGKRVLYEGDVVKVDVTADLEGYVADAARTMVVGNSNPLGLRLARAAREAFAKGFQAAQIGNTTRDIGRAVEEEVRRHGFTVFRQLAGHGVGRSIHDPPCVPNYDEPRAREELVVGMVFTIEPIISAGGEKLRESSDGWTVGAADGSLCAHHEETILITRCGPIILTMPEESIDR